MFMYNIFSDVFMKFNENNVIFSSHQAVNNWFCFWCCISFIRENYSFMYL